MTVWQTPPFALTLNLGDVHLWRASLDVAPSWGAELYGLLAQDERDKADRFRFPHHRARYIAGRGQLRLLLSRYLNQSPAELRFDYGPYGKPALASDQGGDWLQFNLAHSEALVLYAVARDRSLGVDLEWMRPQVSWQAIAQQFFAPQEVAVLHQLPAVEQCAAFFRGWTRKEAYLKALGNGLQIPLSQVQVTMEPGVSARLLKTTAHGGVERWHLHDIEVAPDYTAAIAIEGQHNLHYSPAAVIRPC